MTLPSAVLTLLIAISSGAAYSRVASPSGAATDIDSASNFGEELATGSPAVRQFHEVLEELLAEMGRDIREGQIADLKRYFDSQGIGQRHPASLLFRLPRTTDCRKISRKF